MADNNMNIKEAAAELDINYSAAKAIVKVFRTTGRVKKIERKQESLINSIKLMRSSYSDHP